MLISLVVFVVTAASLAQETFVAQVEPNFTVWNLWSCSGYRQAYAWSRFTEEFAKLNSLKLENLDYVPSGITVVLPQANFDYGKLERCHLSPLPTDSEQLSPPETQNVAAFLVSELEELKTGLEQDFTDFDSKLKLLEGRLGTIEGKIPPDFKPTSSEADISKQLSALENRLAKAESGLVDIKIEMVDWPIKKTERASTEQATGQSDLIILFGNKVVPIAPIVAASLACLMLILGGMFLYFKRRELRREFEQEKQGREIRETVAKTALEVKKTRGNLLARSYGWKTLDFQIPHDLRTKESPEVVTLVETKRKEVGQTRPQVLTPCFSEMKTPPIFIDNLPNHIRHCDICQEKLSLKSSGNGPEKKIEAEKVAAI